MLKSQLIGKLLPALIILMKTNKHHELHRSGLPIFGHILDMLEWLLPRLECIGFEGYEYRHYK